MTREEAHRLVDYLYDHENTTTGNANQAVQVDTSVPDTAADEPVRELPEGKRVVRTKASGDRVYLLDDVKKTRQWVTNPQVLESTGFAQEDVVEIEEREMLTYQMGPALYKVD